MRILHISTRLILGGSQENVVLSCEEQSRRGHEVHLAFGPIYGPEGSLLDRVEKFRTPDARRIETYVVPHLGREIDTITDWLARRELRQLVHRLNPDIVHTHSSKAGILGRLAAWDVKPRPTILHTIHGPPFMPVDGSPLRRLKVRLLNHAYTIAERKAAKHCHGIVSVADAMAREFLKRGIGAPGQYTTVRSGIEQAPYLAPFHGESREEVRASLELAPTDFVVGTVARLAEHKGHDDLLAAIGPRLLERKNWKLLWVGDGWWRDRLIARARAMGLVVGELDSEFSRVSSSPAHILLTGLVPPQRVPGLIRSMDVLAHPSTREGLPRTVPQALLCGVCPVAYDVDGTGEACLDMQTGRLVPAGDTARLREAIEWCEANPDQRRKLAQSGRERCVRDFSVEAMVDGLDRAYETARQVGRR
jgi:glycosyltransferase involved in cell wall biosynthesis